MMERPKIRRTPENFPKPKGSEENKEAEELPLSERPTIELTETEKEAATLGVSFAEDVLAELMQFMHSPDSGSGIRSAATGLLHMSYKAKEGIYQELIESGIAERHGVERMKFLAKMLPSMLMIDLSAIDAMTAVLGILQTAKGTSVFQRIKGILKMAPSEERAVVDEIMGKLLGDNFQEYYADLPRKTAENQSGVKNSAALVLGTIIPCAYTNRTIATAIVTEITHQLDQVVRPWYERKVGLLSDQIADATTEILSPPVGDGPSLNIQPE